MFLVNTVQLAKQQAEAITAMLPYDVRCVIGEDNVDYWKMSDWETVLDSSQILVATAQVIVDAIKKSFLKLDQINVLVFDECHHGNKGHPFAELMRQCSEASTDVRIIGLSGMLIGINNKLKPSNVYNTLRTLEAAFASTIVTVNNVDDLDKVTACSTNAEEKLLRYYKSDMLNPSCNGVSQILNEHQLKLEQIKFDDSITMSKALLPTTPRRIKDLIVMMNDFHEVSKEMGAFGGYLSLLSSLVQLELKKRWCETERFKSVVRTCITVFERCIRKLENDVGISRDDPSVILPNSFDKIIKLVGLLRMKFNDPNRVQDLQCLIFVKRRSTAKVIYHILKAYKTHDDSFPIKADFVVGVNNEVPESIEAILSANYNTDALDRFKNKEINCIIATNVLEEGIDLQMCNLVVMYDEPKTYRSYVQARGRARVSNSLYAVLVENSDVDEFNAQVLNWRAVEVTLKSELQMKTLDRKAPTEEEIQEQRQEPWPPFYTKVSRSKLNYLNSVR